MITDEEMRRMMPLARGYTLVILKSGPSFGRPGTDGIIWEHGRRNFSLRAAGKLSIVCPVRDGSGVHGIGIFDADADEAKRIMDEDPGVKEGIFEYEVYPCCGFPGDCLPGE